MIDPIVSLVLSLSLALLFFMAAQHKLADRLHFQAQLGAYQLLPETILPLVARFLPWLEMSLVFMILIPMTRAFAAGITALLLSVYALAMGINLLRGRADIDCGCGSRPQVLSVWLLLRNSVLVAGALLLIMPASEHSLAWSEIPFIFLLTAVLAMIYLIVDQLVSNHAVLTNRSSSHG